MWNVINKQSPDNFNPTKFDNSTKIDNAKTSWHWFQVSLICIFKLTIFTIAVFLSWKCNHSENLFVRVLISTLSGMFSELYIIFYAVYRIYLGNKCPI